MAHPSTENACRRARFRSGISRRGGRRQIQFSPRKQASEAGLLGLRAALGGFANLRPVFAFHELTVNSPLRPEIIDGLILCLFRELLGGLYYGKPREWEQGKGRSFLTP